MKCSLGIPNFLEEISIDSHFIDYFWLCWVFVAAWGLFSSCREWGLLSGCGARASLQRLLLLWSTGSRVHKPHSGGSWAWLFHSLWNLPGSGIEPVSPALAGEFLTTEPSGKFHTYMLLSADPLTQNSFVSAQPSAILHSGLNAFLPNFYRQSQLYYKIRNGF